MGKPRHTPTSCVSWICCQEETGAVSTQSPQWHSEPRHRAPGWSFKSSPVQCRLAGRASSLPPGSGNKTSSCLPGTCAPCEGCRGLLQSKQGAQLGRASHSSGLPGLPMHSAHVLSWAAPVQAQDILSDISAASHTCAHLGCAFMDSPTNQAPLGLTLKPQQPVTLPSSRETATGCLGHCLQLTVRGSGDLENELQE